MTSGRDEVTILGAGLAGSLMTILLARRGIAVKLIERRSDIRTHALAGGRSINLALADRGLHALEQAGLLEAVQPLLIAMSGRMLHDIHGGSQYVAYGQRKHEVIYSVSRNGLTQLLLNHAATYPNVIMLFDTECSDIDTEQNILSIYHNGDTIQQPYTYLIASDGYQSVIRKKLLEISNSIASDELLPHGYKELTLPAGSNGEHQLQPNALHIWPRGGFMLIALSNTDGTFTVTLFLPFESENGSPSFASLKDAQSINAFFNEYFPDARQMMPNLAGEFLSHPTGKMHTIRTPRWSNDRSAVLIGDAAHAIVPFHGQGMNCAFEDCIALDQLMQSHSFADAIKLFSLQRQPDANAIADMALENYIEMRDTVRHPKFLLQKELSFELERRFPDRFIPRYSMVMFHHSISYSIAYERGKIQAQILDELTRDANSISQVDMALASELIEERLSKLKSVL